MRFLIFISLALVLHLACAQYHSSSATAGVNFENLSPSHAVGGALAQSQSENRPRQRRMYAMCPPNFQRIGQECFTYPQQHSSWLEAHFFCKDKNARLAEPEKYADRKLREFLLKYEAESGDKDPIWIGATYDYMNNIWQWSISGRNLTYNAFSKKYYEKNTNMDNQCAVYDPQLKYRWSSRTCVDKHRFICQHKMPKVSENNRHKVYHRWNATYPNQYANEVILEVIDHRGKGRYNRRVIAEGSDEEMVVSTRPRNRQIGRRRPRPTTASLPHENDVNYQPQSSAHPNDIYQHYNPTVHPRFRTTTLVPVSSTNNNDNEIAAPIEVITPVPDNGERMSRKRTMLDRKLQRQREKELKRLQRKKERQEKMRREKEERNGKLRLEREQQRRKMKEEKQRQRVQQQKELEELRQRESEQTVERQQRERQLQQDRQEIHKQEIENLRRQKESEERKHLEDQEEERRRRAYLQNLKEKEEQERARKEEIQRLDRERQHEEEQRIKEERKVQEERKRKEYEEKLKQAENERARQLAEEQERKRLHDEENRRRLEEEEKQRQANLKKQLDEEEERSRLKRLEEERIGEEQELARLREEQRKRAEIQRKREEEIARLEAEQKRIEEEEARIKEELEESERQAKLQHEAEIRKAEEEVRFKEEERKRAEEQVERERQEKLKQAKLIEESRKLENKEHISTNLKNRIASLPPELRLEFLKKRKQRKREKLLREKILRQQQAESTNNEA